MKKGFTLIEVLVTVAITVIISAFVMTYSRVGQNQVALYVESQKVAELILRAKSLAISTYNSPSPAQSCGYGVDIDYGEGIYSIFSYEPSPDPSTGRPDCSNINPISKSSRVYMADDPTRTELVSLQLGSSLVFKSTPSDKLTAVLFVPPAPRTLISSSVGGSISSEPAKVYLETIDGSGEANIVVSLAGQVDF